MNIPRRSLAVALASCLHACGATRSLQQDPQWFASVAMAHRIAPVAVLPEGWDHERAAPAADSGSRVLPSAGDALLFHATLETSESTDSVFVAVEFDGASQPRAGHSALRLLVFDPSGAKLGESLHQIETRHLTRGVHPAARALLERGIAWSPERVRTEVLPGVLAMQAILRMVQDDPLLSPWLWRVVAKPSVWSVLTNFGVEIDIKLSWSEPVGEELRTPGDRDPLRLPVELELNDSPALRCSLILTEPQAPYSLAAGLCSMVAERPDGSGTRFLLQRVAARPRTRVSQPGQRD